MVNQRFSTYYETHPESSNLSLILSENSKQSSRSILKKSHTPKTQKKSTDFADLQKSVEMKIELALLYLNRSTACLQQI
jgi:hypothetical protein